MIDTTTKNFVAAAPTAPVQQPVTALAVQPIAPRALLDSHNALIDTYRQQYRDAAKAGEVLPPHDSSAPRGYSSATELQARNARFYFTVGALVLVEAIAAWGMVQTANIAALIGDVWTIPLWLSLTGIAAFVTIQHVHAGEQRLSPENIELVRAENEFAIQHMDAETRQLAIKLAARNDRERLQLERERNDLQRQQAAAQTLEVRARIADQMHRHTQPQSSHNRLNTYRPHVTQQAQEAPRNAQERPSARVEVAPVGYEVDGDMDALTLDYEVMGPAVQAVEEAAPIEPIVDPVRLQLLNWTADLYLDRDSSGVYRRMDASGRLLKGTITPWAKRGGLPAAQRQQMLEVLRQITPPLFSYDDTAKCWCVNVQRYRRAGAAVAAIDAALTPRSTWE